MDFPGKIRMDPGWIIWKYFWLETLMVRCLVDQMDFCFGSQKNDVAPSSIWVRRVREYVGWVFGGLGGQQGAQRCRN